MAFPVLKPQDTRRYPDAKTTVVDWSGFGQKLMQGVVAGIGLSQSIKKSNEESALAAMNIKNQQSAIAARSIELTLKQKQSESTLALHGQQQKINDLRMQTEFSATRLAADALKAQREYGKERRIVGALATLNRNDDAYSDALHNHAKAELDMGGIVDPVQMQQRLNEWEREVTELEKTLGMSLAKLGMGIAKDSPEVTEKLVSFEPKVMQEKFMDTLIVPILASELSEREVQDFGGMLGGMGGMPYTETTTKEVNVPLKIAKTKWLYGRSLGTFDDLRVNTPDRAAFDKWAKKQGLGKLLSRPVPGVEPGPVMDEGVSSGIKAIRPGLATERISEQAGRAMRDITIESPLIKSTQSFTQKLREKLTSKEFTLLQAITGNPIGALLSPNMLRGGTEAVQWIAEKTGIGIKAADKLHDKLRDLLPMAGEAEDAFMSDPEKVTAETDHWVERRARLAAELKTATPARKLVINETIGLINEQLGETYYETRAELIEAAKKGKITREEADKIAKDKGWV